MRAVFFGACSLLVACAEASAPQDDGTSNASSTTGADGGAGGAGGSGGLAAGGGGGEAGSTTTGIGGSGGDAGVCGDDAVDPGEDCDGASSSTCEDLGYQGGPVACTAACAHDLSTCSACGNGVVDAPLDEECDFDSQGNPLVTATCASLGFTSSGANPGCDLVSCQFDTKICLCGNGTIDPEEPCDGTSFGTKTCITEGFSGGTLACTPYCELDTTGCSGCGNGTIEAGEQCDDSNTVPGDGCDANCQIEGAACDPDGVYQIVGAPVAYSCCNGLVSINVSAFLLSQDGASISSSPSNPVAMTGSATTCPSGSLLNSGTLPGGCTESYSVNGSYSGPDTWSGTYQVTFTGSDCSCFGGMFGTPCISQVFPVTAQR